MHLGGLAGTYTTPAIYVEVSAVFTNTTSIGLDRSSGRPEASYIVERLIDTAAREMEIDRPGLRRCNTVPAGAKPFKTGLEHHRADVAGAGRDGDGAARTNPLGVKARARLVMSGHSPPS